MGHYIPPGRLSSHRHDGHLLQIQTEFAHRPTPRITSSVVLEGRVVHKVENDWIEPTETPEQQGALDRALAEQHREVISTVQTEAARLCEGQPTPPTADDFPDPTFRDTMAEILRTVPFVIGMFELDSEGKTTFAVHYRDIYADWQQELEIIARFTHNVRTIIRVGDFRHGVCSFNAENIILVELHKRLFGIATDPSGSIGQLRCDFPELFEVSDA